MFLLGLGAFTLASLGCGLSPSTGALVAARLAQGAAGALMVPQVLSGIQIHFTGTARARAQGMLAVALSGGAVAGQVLGGVLVTADLSGLGWRPIFLVNVPVGIVLLAAGARLLPADTPGAGRRLDLGGVALLSAATLLAIVPLLFGRETGWPAWTWASLAACPPVLALFARPAAPGRVSAARPRCAGPPRRGVDAGGARRGHRHVLRAAVRPRALPAAGARAQRALLGDGARAVGRRVRGRRAARAAPAVTRRRTRARRRLPAARGGVRGDRADARGRDGARRPARARRARPRPRVRAAARAADGRRPGPARGRPQRPRQHELPAGGVAGIAVFGTLYLGVPGGHAHALTVVLLGFGATALAAAAASFAGHRASRRDGQGSRPARRAVVTASRRV
ncbi:MFS transporter [Actinomadura madurae]|nr:MFS transporter [Actinomadura madurae]MCP9969240.1 MFS transporter [Actinomadura madurae]